MKAKQVLDLLKISRITLMTYVKINKIKVTKLSNGKYDYDDDSVFSLVANSSRHDVIYTRVSSDKFNDDLLNQSQILLNYCKDNKIQIQKSYSDISLAYDLNGSQFNELTKKVFERTINNIYITNKNRISRGAFDAISNMFKFFGTSIVIVDDKNDNLDLEINDELIPFINQFKKL